MIELVNVTQGKIESRHRQAHSAGRAARRLLRAVERRNGAGCYVRIVPRRDTGQPLTELQMRNYILGLNGWNLQRG